MTAAPTTPSSIAVVTDRVAQARRRRPRVSIVVASLMLVVSALVIIVVPFVSIYNPYGLDLAHSLAPPFSSWTHPLGTDALGRDMLSRLAVAGRTSMVIAVPALLINMVLGLVLGLTAGYFGGFLNTVIMGLADLQLSFPIIILLVMIVAVVGPSVESLVIVLGVTYWVRYARLARVVALSLREREFVLAARTFGASSPWILRKHLFPQLLSSIAIVASFDLGVIIILEASLSYLGLGIQPPTPSWGRMIFEGQDYATRDIWLVVLPSIAIFLVVASVQILSQRFTGEREPQGSVRTV